MQKTLPIIICCIFCVFLLSLTSCISNRNYVTTFTPPEQETPKTLDMNYGGPVANIAVGDFTVKARGASTYIGDGLREMLETALFESLRFNVLDRLDPEGLLAEQKLSYSKMASKKSPKLGRQMEVAELMVYGTVTEFEAEAMGAVLDAGMPKVPVKAKTEAKDAHMAIDIRVVDVASGRLVAAKRIEGSAMSGQAAIGTKVGGGKAEMPINLAAYKNTPMELAIRDCIYRSVIYSVYGIPQRYFKH